MTGSDVSSPRRRDAAERMLAQRNTQGGYQPTESHRRVVILSLALPSDLSFRSSHSGSRITESREPSQLSPGLRRSSITWGFCLSRVYVSV